MLKFKSYPATVLELSEYNNMSETWVRDQLSVTPHKVSSIEGQRAKLYAAETGESCPCCNHVGEFKKAGEEGTALGAVCICPKCGKWFNEFTKDEVPAIASKSGKKRVFLNPQYKINQKLKAVSAVGGTLEYDKSDKSWILDLPKGKGRVMTPEQFSLETPSTIIK
jgi:phage FluMu protein Com